MDKTFRFRNFKVYQDAMKWNKRIYRLVKNMPLEIRSQIIRSSFSVILNIAEGSAKSSDKDFNRYIENSLGSVNETIAGLEFSAQIDLLRKEVFQSFLEEGESIAKQLGGLSKKLKVNC